jgi:hypothetical protein
MCDECARIALELERICHALKMQACKDSRSGTMHGESHGKYGESLKNKGV